MGCTHYVISMKHIPYIIDMFLNLSKPKLTLQGYIDIGILYNNLDVIDINVWNILSGNNWDNIQ